MIRRVPGAHLGGHVPTPHVVQERPAPGRSYRNDSSAMSWLASALRASLVDDLEHLSTRDATDHITRVVLAGHHWTLPDERVIELVMAQHGFLALLIAEARAAGADRATLTLARTLGAEPCSPVLRRRKMLELARVTGELLNFTNRTAHQESHADR